MQFRGVFVSVIIGLSPATGWAHEAGAPALEVTVAEMSLSPHPGLSRLARAPRLSPRPARRPDWTIPAMRWDGTRRGARWSLAVLAAIRSHGRPLLDVVPHDIGEWCPAYAAGGPEQRAAFWAGLTSALVFHESTFRQTAVGGGGRWFGLTQIAPGTARWRNCDVRSGRALLDGEANLRCAIRIMAITVPRDGVVSAGMRGVAADWGPFHSRRKREDMRQWVSAQDYCRAPGRPRMRPAEPGRPVPQRPEELARFQR